MLLPGSCFYSSNNLPGNTHFIHETCELFDYIYVSAGVRGLQFKLNPQDLIQVVDMTVADLTVFEIGTK